MIAIPKNCAWCDDFFIATKRNQKYCCEECARLGGNRRQQMSRRGGRTQREFAKKQMESIETGKLDKALEDARSKGLTYAERQIQETLALYGRFNDEH